MKSSASGQQQQAAFTKTSSLVAQHGGYPGRQFAAVRFTNLDPARLADPELLATSQSHSTIRLSVALAIRAIIQITRDKCQNYDWNDGSHHKERCHLFEINRKLSDVYSTMKVSDVSSGWKYGLGINDLTRSLEQKANQWESLHRATLSLIQSTVFVNKNPKEETPHFGVFLKLVGNGPNYDYRSFIIDKVALIPFSLRESGCGRIASGTTLPPGFDLHRFITHVNRGITHFHDSYWPLPRRLSDADFEAAEPPNQWLRYMRLHHNGFFPMDKFEDA
ncbi:hypothetical protein DFH09DRAFT_1334423 [Mycena vulgaris]|nr:hypothetical protein DFH09DRAFT_1334423 [Mycena vulgaris]